MTTIQEAWNWRSDQQAKVMDDYQRAEVEIGMMLIDHWHRRLKQDIAFDMRAMKLATIACEFERKVRDARTMESYVATEE